MTVTRTIAEADVVRLVQQHQAEVWRYLIPCKPFPRARHAELIKLNIQPSDAEIIRVQQAVELYREVA